MWFLKTRQLAPRASSSFSSQPAYKSLISSVYVRLSAQSNQYPLHFCIVTKMALGTAPYAGDFLNTREGRVDTFYTVEFIRLATTCYDNREPRDLDSYLQAYNKSESRILYSQFPYTNDSAYGIALYTNYQSSLIETISGCRTVGR
jgi:hypothetical protein